MKITERISIKKPFLLNSIKLFTFILKSQFYYHHEWIVNYSAIFFFFNRKKVVVQSLEKRISIFFIQRSTYERCLCTARTHTYTDTNTYSTCTICILNYRVKDPSSSISYTIKLWFSPLECLSQTFSFSLFLSFSLTRLLCYIWCLYNKSSRYCLSYISQLLNLLKYLYYIMS